MHASCDTWFVHFSFLYSTVRMNCRISVHSPTDGIWVFPSFDCDQCCMNMYIALCLFVGQGKFNLFGCIPRSGSLMRMCLAFLGSPQCFSTVIGGLCQFTFQASPSQSFTCSLYLSIFGSSFFQL